MSVKELFEERSHEEIEEIFDTWAGRDFEDLPLDTFFAALEEIGVRRPPQHVEMEGEVVGNKPRAERREMVMEALQLIRMEEYEKHYPRQLQETGILLDEMGGIGDSASDLTFLSIIGRSAAPANAADEVKAAVDYVSPYEDGDGVVDILRRWVEGEK